MSYHDCFRPGTNDFGCIFTFFLGYFFAVVLSLGGEIETEEEHSPLFFLCFPLSHNRLLSGEVGGSDSAWSVIKETRFLFIYLFFSWKLCVNEPTLLFCRWTLQEIIGLDGK